MSKKRFIGLARVSSREQEREGFSLDVQEEAMHEYARREKGTIVRIFRIAETATKTEQRKTFHETIEYAKRNADQLDGILFYKIDRAARNLRDMVTLEELESEHGLPFISITQPVQNTPTGKMVRRTLATMAAFQTEQQSLDIREGVAKRVESGWFPSNPPFGYRNVRREGKSVVEVDPMKAQTIRHIFYLRAFHELPVESIVEQLYRDGHYYSQSKPRFTPSKVNAILHDRSYLGFVRFRGDWFPGQHDPLVDQVTWDRVQVSFGDQCYRSHEMVYASELIECGFCGHSVTGEEKEKATKCGLMTYTYYRCAKYQRGGHPRIRVRESEFDRQILDMLSDFRLDDCDAQKWAVQVARSFFAREQGDSFQLRLTEIRRQISRLEGQRKELVSMRLSRLISDEELQEQKAELAEREASLRSQLETVSKSQGQIEATARRAARIFDHIRGNWNGIRRLTKRRILKLLFGGFVLDGTVLVVDNGTPLELLRHLSNIP